MSRAPLYLLSLLCLFACTVDRDNAVPMEQVESIQPVAAPSVTGTSAMSGQEAYEHTCAQCHETGVDGAPVTQNPADWETRSSLWQAVLMEHAKEGYLGMPAKGNDPELSDMTVSAAAEYMLEITFPNLPAD